MKIEQLNEGSKLNDQIINVKRKLDSITCLISYSKSIGYRFRINCEAHHVDVPPPMVQDLLYEMQEKYESELSSLERKFKKL
jgi:hypothetical protein